MTPNNEIDILLRDLQERRKELNCLYQVEELLNKRGERDIPQDQLFADILAIIPIGWQFPDLAQVSIDLGIQVYTTPGFRETPWKLTAEIKMQAEVVGHLTVSYSREIPLVQESYFLKEENRLINTIADRIGQMLLHEELKKVYSQYQEAESTLSKKTISEWRVIIDLLESSNPQLFIYLAQKMLHFLCWKGVMEAKQLLSQIGSGVKAGSGRSLLVDDGNQPVRKESMTEMVGIYKEVFRIASENLSEDQILSHIHRWVEDEKTRFLVKALEDPNSSLSDLINAITRYRYLEEEGVKISSPNEKGLRVSLIRHFFSDQLEFIDVAKEQIEIKDYYELVKRIIFLPMSHGKLGGKSAGLFLATRIVKRGAEKNELFRSIRTPKTWYITSDALVNFLHYNNLESVLEQKYKDMDEIHVEYPNIIQIFKNAYFPPEIARGLSMALDDLGDKPIIVRSSSLLEDRVGAAFSGKYKSLFLANRGSKEERLNALTDAIAEVYASTFGPDPIEYRTERGLLDFYEEMGIMIQEVVGNRVGNYFLPTFAGVAFSRNEFRWSARIKREDGLIRLVPGLGTRAVDRVAEDYPILIAPGKPDLRVNVTPDEIIRYSPKNIDVINLDTNSFETIDINRLIRESGADIPGIQHAVSVVRDNMIHKPTSLFNIDFEKDKLLVTFEGLLQGTDFVRQIGSLLKELETAIGTPVDIEFAHDGSHLYLLQCRAQSHAIGTQAAPIPKDIGQDQILFSADHYVSNGHVPDITHVVYIDPESYVLLADLMDLKTIGRIVGKLNKILPKRQFILMGPGRWGSRGDIKLGVEVTYSDINNTAVLIEIARKKGNYVPELSFGTHFFQDLVEASIRYLPLYPDDEGILFNEAFFTRSDNILSDLLPEYAEFKDSVRVIDIPHSANGQILRILMNADLDEAVGILAHPDTRLPEPVGKKEAQSKPGEEFWNWRYYMAEKIASHLDPGRFGVKGIYLFGSTKNATAGPGSDIDLLVHFTGTGAQRQDLLSWLEGWSLTLAEINYQRTGYKSDGLLDVHLVSDEDIANKTSYAVKIGAITDAARLLPMPPAQS